MRIMLIQPNLAGVGVGAELSLALSNNPYKLFNGVIKGILKDLGFDFLFCSYLSFYTLDL